MNTTGYKKATSVTPHDTDTFTRSEAVYVGGAGTLVALVDGVDVTFTAVAGGIIPIRTTRIKDTGTTATGIVVLR